MLLGKLVCRTHDSARQAQRQDHGVKSCFYSEFGVGSISHIPGAYPTFSF